MKPHGEAMAALTAGKVWTADQLLGAGLVGELELRQQILSPAQLHAGRIARQLTVDGKLDDWPAAFEISAETSRSLTGHVYFPNDWRGANDLSARVRLAHDGERMYFGADISDDVWHGKDSLTLHFSRAGYLDWREENQKFDMNVQVAAPKDDEPVTMRRAGVEMVARRRAGGYVVEGSITLEQLKVAAGGRIGMLVMVSDIDTPLNLNKASWSVKQILLIPNEPNFAYWSDARTCGEILFEE